MLLDPRLRSRRHRIECYQKSFALESKALDENVRILAFGFYVFAICRYFLLDVVATVASTLESRNILVGASCDMIDTVTHIREHIVEFGTSLGKSALVFCVLVFSLYYSRPDSRYLVKQYSVGSVGNLDVFLIGCVVGNVNSVYKLLCGNRRIYGLYRVGERSRLLTLLGITGSECRFCARLGRDVQNVSRGMSLDRGLVEFDISLGIGKGGNYLNARGSGYSLGKLGGDARELNAGINDELHHLLIVSLNVLIKSGFRKSRVLGLSKSRGNS